MSGDSADAMDQGRFEMRGIYRKARNVWRQPRARRAVLVAVGRWVAGAVVKALIMHLWG